MSLELSCYIAIANWYMSRYECLFLHRRKMSQKLNCIITMDKLLMKYFKRAFGILVKKNFKIENVILTAEIEYGQKVTVARYLT